MPGQYLVTLMETASQQSLLYQDRHWSAAFSQNGKVAALASPEWDAIAYDLPSCSKAGVKLVAGPGAVMNPVDVRGRSSCRPLGTIQHDDSSQVESPHIFCVLPLSDEFRERVAFCGSHEKFGKCLAQRICNEAQRGATRRNMG